jgi:hypothetical protein
MVIARLEGLGKYKKNSMTSTGLEPTTSRFVAYTNKITHTRIFFDEQSLEEGQHSLDSGFV